MGVRRLEELVAWQLADAVKSDVYRLLRQYPDAARDFQFRDQLRGAATSVAMNVAEGFYRYRAREFARFVSIALASLGEATLWLQDGVERGYFPEGSCDATLRLAGRCRIAMFRLHRSLRAMEPSRN